jgi:hypothetical protein
VVSEKRPLSVAAGAWTGRVLSSKHQAPERLVQFGSVDAVEPDQLPGRDDGVAVDDLGRAANRYSG